VRRSVASLEREARELERAAAGAESVAELEARERELSQQSARLRAAIERDERVRAEVKNGVCPVLGDRCLSFSEGQTFESYFGDQLTAYRTQLAVVERESTRVVEAVRASRVASTAAAQLERERQRLQQERELLTRHEEKLASIDGELASLAEATPEVLDKLQSEMFGVDGMLRIAREDARRYAELEPLRVRLQEIAGEGKRKREERDEIAAAAGAVDSLTEEIKETDERLRRLNDPRGRAAGLRAEAGREETLKREAQDARDALAALEQQKHALDAQSEQFRELDAEWSRVVAERDRTAAGYREYLASAELAATLPAREAETANASERAARAAREDAEARETHARAVAAYDRDQHNHDRGHLSLAREQAAATSAQLDAAQGRASSLGTDIARLDEIREAWHEELRAVDHLKNLHETTEFIRETLKQAGPLVTESYLYNISIEANQLFREITDEGGRALRWSKEYEIILEENGYERSFINLSGGEQVAAALSVRLALLKQLSDIRIAFFDEPTINMDNERRQNLARQIGQVRDFDQLFVISHDDTFEEAVDHIVAVTGQERGVNGEMVKG
jgi:exonuclease SbcC